MSRSAFVFNFHRRQSFTDYGVRVDEAGEYGMVLQVTKGSSAGSDSWLQVCFWPHSVVQLEPLD